jgi:hypothetical protein
MRVISAMIVFRRGCWVCRLAPEDIALNPDNSSVDSIRDLARRPKFR